MKELIQERLKARSTERRTIAQTRAQQKAEAGRRVTEAQAQAKEQRRRVQQDRSTARQWALAHFNTEGPSGLFDPPVFRVSFQDHDLLGYFMVVEPVAFGRTMIRLTYILAIVDDRLCWRGYNNPKKLFVEQGG